MDKSFDPRKYGMTLCLECQGTGKSSDQDEEMSVCRACGGFGLIRKAGVASSNVNSGTQQKENSKSPNEPGGRK